MQINTNSIVSMLDANQNFSKVAKIVDETGVAVIMKNDSPRYIMLEYSQVQIEEFADDASIMEIGKSIIKRNLKAFQELAK